MFIIIKLLKNNILNKIIKLHTNICGLNSKIQLDITHNMKY